MPSKPSDGEPTPAQFVTAAGAVWLAVALSQEESDAERKQRMKLDASEMHQALVDQFRWYEVPARRAQLPLLRLVESQAGRATHEERVRAMIEWAVNPPFAPHHLKVKDDRLFAKLGDLASALGFLPELSDELRHARHDARNAQSPRDFGKIGAIAAGVAVIIATGGLAAAALAPAGLAGGAAVLAGLAALGGGAVAAGGLGIAGGLAVITALGAAGGGAVAWGMSVAGIDPDVLISETVKAQIECKLLYLGQHPNRDGVVMVLNELKKAMKAADIQIAWLDARNDDGAPSVERAKKNRTTLERATDWIHKQAKKAGLTLD